jgi:predicted phosphodiesterase
MKIAVLADIHANIRAFEAVVDDVERWTPDAVLVLGDVVNRGPRPAECLRLALALQRQCGWLLLRGNHEDHVIAHAQRAYTGPEAQLVQTSRWTFEQLGRQVTALQAWPFSLSLSKDSQVLRAAHASLRHNRDGVFAETPDSTLALQIGPWPPAAFVTGHTHKALIRRLNGALVVNAGPSACPLTAIRAAYARLEYAQGAWQAALVRLDYDRARAVDSGVMEAGGPLMRLIRAELSLARSQIYEWSTVYEKAVLAGQLGAEESVTRFLGGLP